MCWCWCATAERETMMCTHFQTQALHIIFSLAAASARLRWRERRRRRQRWAETVCVCLCVRLTGVDYDDDGGGRALCASVCVWRSSSSGFKLLHMLDPLFHYSRMSNGHSVCWYVCETRVQNHTKLVNVWLCARTRVPRLVCQERARCLCWCTGAQAGERMYVRVKQQYWIIAANMYGLEGCAQICAT